MYRFDLVCYRDVEGLSYCLLLNVANEQVN